MDVRALWSVRRLCGAHVRTDARLMRQVAHPLIGGRAHQGGPRHAATGAAAPAAGKRAGAATACATRRRPAAQHGQRHASIRATRARNPMADSRACGQLAGMASAARAWANFAPLQAEANTP